MATTIHPTAIVDRTAVIHEGACIDAYAVIGPRVSIGPQTRVRSHAIVVCNSTIGGRCDIHPGAVVGGNPQDQKYQGEDSLLLVGDNNVIRECVTINRGTGLGGGRTEIGNHNLIMAYAHIAHDCIIGNNVIITNSAQLAGHIKVEDMAILSGMVAVHHFVTIGSLSFIAAFSAVRADVPPYMIADGTPARVRKLNFEGLKRRNVPEASVEALKAAFRLVYRSDLSRAQAIGEIETMELARDPAVCSLISHYRASEAGSQGRALEALRKDKVQKCRTAAGGGGS